MTANLHVDFQGKSVWGNVLLQMKKEHGDANKVVLDTRYLSKIGSDCQALTPSVILTSRTSSLLVRKRNGTLLLEWNRMAAR